MHVITVHGPAGGVGKTLIALHLAYQFAGNGLSTVLVDLSQYGAIAPWLRIPRGASSGVSGLIAAGATSAARLHAALVPAPGAGESLHLVLSSGPAKMDQIKAGEVETLLRQLSAMAEVVVVDTSSELTERVLGSILASTKVLLTVSPRVIAGWQTLELLDLLRSAHVGREHLGAVFNRTKSGGKFGLTEYQQVIGLPVLGTIPESPELHTAAEEGGPPLLRKSGPGIKALRQLASDLIPIPVQKEMKRSWLWSR
ncbi:MAG TPA: ParA family protein [Symbiobacteriaceae bacterium]|nr:ParA family protein [Symbiobacteriaceae bacterium]